MAEPANKFVPRGATNAPELTVSELSMAIKRALEDGFGYVRLRGEISGYRGPHSSGHAYFALKDDKAKIEAVIWKGNLQRLKIRPEEGMEVIAQGKITSYPGASKYQIVIESLEPAGLGALMALLEERKKKFAAEGLFAPERKKKLPFFPRVVGIVTSPTGAVIRDMLAGFTERCPTHVLLWPVRVQGEGSAEEVARAIHGFNALPPGGRIPRPDVLIVARGGGSLEDLWGFNEEIVVRAAAASQIPLIAAVGHETDWTLIDLVADARAPTPTKAAEWAVPKFQDLVAETEDFAHRLKLAARSRLEGARTSLKAAARGLPAPMSLTRPLRQRFDAVEKELQSALRLNTAIHDRRHRALATRLTPRLVAVRIERAHHRLSSVSQRAGEALSRFAAERRRRLERAGGRLSPQTARIRLQRAEERLAATGERLKRAGQRLLADRRQRLSGFASLLGTLGYQGVLKRGYAVVRAADGSTVRSVAAVSPAARLEVELSDGRLDVAVTGSRPKAKPVSGSASGDGEPQMREPEIKPRRGSPQGSLF